MFTRIIYGSRISLSIGLIGVAVSFIFGVVLGGISGFYGGVIDVLIQRIIEFIRSVPSIPLWMALSASLPQDWSNIRVYFGITIILSLIGWTFLARAVRGRFLSMREEGVHPRGPLRRRRRNAHHPAPYGALFLQPPDRLRHPRRSGDDSSAKHRSASWAWGCGLRR